MNSDRTISANKSQKTQLSIIRPGLFRPESIEARQMAWLGRPSVALEFPVLLSSVASVLMAVVAVALITFGSYARRIELHGVVLPSTGLIQVSAPGAGWVQSMGVNEGQTVAAGALLYVINTDTSNSAGNTQQQILQALADQRMILVHQIARKIELRNQQDAELQRKIENLQVQTQQIDRSMTIQSDFVDSVRNNYGKFINLQQQGVATLLESLTQQQNWMYAQGQLERLKSDALHLQGQLIEAQSQQANNDLDIDNEIDEMRAKITNLDQQVATSKTRHSIAIHAPGAGTVTTVTIHPGQTVASGASMLTIVPSKDAMQVELIAPSSAIAFLHPSERVLLRYSAFPYQKFGQYSGMVTEVAHAALQPEELNSLVPALPPSERSKMFYRVIVKPDLQEVKVYGRPEPLQASMQVDASVLLEKRRLYQWIIQPLYDLYGTSA